MTKTSRKLMKFNDEIAEFLGKKMATRAQAFKIVIAYVKERNLQVCFSSAQRASKLKKIHAKTREIK